ncbi:MAG TPA: hypothetical protein VFV38_48620, partial [Ktedonobacteraceae bacterium]|nr:hypothetical protein [Ktedonobacteraceae bacterium]
WLYWGDEHGITLEQVQHIMFTWAQRMQHGLSRDEAHQLATDLVAHVGDYSFLGARYAAFLPL